MPKSALLFSSFNYSARHHGLQWGQTNNGSRKSAQKPSTCRSPINKKIVFSKYYLELFKGQQGQTWGIHSVAILLAFNNRFSQFVKSNNRIKFFRSLPF